MERGEREQERESKSEREEGETGVDQETGESCQWIDARGFMQELCRHRLGRETRPTLKGAMPT